MALGSLLFVGLLAMSPHWVVVDLPYPDSGGSSAVAGATPESLIAESIAQHLKKSHPALKHEILELRIDGPRATVRMAIANHTETLRLELRNNEWRVVQ